MANVPASTRGQEVYLGSDYLNITAATTTTVKSGGGNLAGISVNKGVDAATITVYDSLAASGTKIATITLSGTGPVFLPLACRFKTGLTIVPSGATDLTILFR